MAIETQATYSRWERGLIRQVRRLHPEQLKVELKARRYRHRFCFEALLERVEELVDRGPENACRLAEEALDWVERNTPDEPQNRFRALSVLGEALSRSGRVSEAQAVFGEAMEMGSSAPLAELGALWWRYALHLGEHGSDAADSLEWATRSVDLAIENAEGGEVGSRESTSVAAAWLARGRVGWWTGERASKAAKCYLASALSATRETPRTALKACEALARTAPLAWMSETGGFHPWKVLRRLRGLDVRFRAMGQSKHSPCRCRLRGLQGLALAHLGHSLTPQSESYVSEAKGALLREGFTCEVARLDMDVSYILLWEGRWTQLARVAKEAIELLRSEGGGCLEKWHASLGRRRLEVAAWEAAYREARGARAPLILPGAEPREESNTWVSGW